MRGTKFTVNKINNLKETLTAGMTGRGDTVSAKSDGSEIEHF